MACVPGDHAELGRSVQDIFDLHELQACQKRRSLQRSVIISIPLPLSSQFMANFLARSFCDRKKEENKIVQGSSFFYNNIFSVPFLRGLDGDLWTT